MNSHTILIVEDELRIRQFLRVAFESEGCKVFEAATVANGLALAGDCRPNLVVLDLGLPDADGLEFIRTLRTWSDVPILVLSARHLETDKVAALDLGADDYLAKPFGVAELLARLRALRRRRDNRSPDDNAIIQFGEIIVDRSKRYITRVGKSVHLTPREYHLLTVLMAQPGKVLTQRQLLREVWGAGHSEDGHYLRIYIGRLRQKLEVTPAEPCHLLTETGIGYRFTL
ncbi:response regulator [Thiothrix lacustris]|uniref:response regulator n=1 Tax=Thiothrix lacustris TaxID=525917 RepID=UPI0027E49FFD|nr:response regulator [Thiothrix lacustris]WMP15864.1 response regulator [Thiothrix lacustris]